MCANTLKQRLHHESNGTCVYCGHPVTLEQMQVDHIIPSSKGGPDSFENFVCSCGDCNQGKKKDTLPEVFFSQMTESKQKTFRNRLNTMVLSGRMSAQKRHLLLTGKPQNNIVPADEITNTPGESLQLEIGQIAGKKIVLSLTFRIE